MTRIGISIGTTFAGDDPREGPRQVLAEASAAARAGLDVLTVGDHHSTGPVAYVQNVPMLARAVEGWLAEGGSPARPYGCLFLLPLWHPVLLAEQVGTLAALGSTPFILQAGVGGGRGQFDAMGVPLGERAARMEEGVRVVKDLFAGEAVDSEIWGVRGARIAPLPPAGVEWWIGGGVAASIDRAARLGDCWYGNADLTPDTARTALDMYREACARYGREPVRIPIRKDVLIAEDRAEAEKVGRALVGGGYRGFEPDAVAYGDPESVADQLSVYGELGYTDIMIRIMTTGPAAVRAVELAGEVRTRLG